MRFQDTGNAATRRVEGQAGKQALVGPRTQGGPQALGGPIDARRATGGRETHSEGGKMSDEGRDFMSDEGRAMRGA